MNKQPNTPTSSAANAHDGQAAADTNQRRKYRITLCLEQSSITQVVIEAASESQAVEKADDLDATVTDDWQIVEERVFVDHGQQVEEVKENENSTRPNAEAGLFDSAIEVYRNRKRDLARGDQVRVPIEISKSAGITCPVFLAGMIYFDLVGACASQRDKDAQLNDLLKTVDLAITNKEPDRVWVSVDFYPRGWKSTEPVRLLAAISPLDIDDPQPAITLMYPYPDYDPNPMRYGD